MWTEEHARQIWEQLKATAPEANLIRVVEKIREVLKKEPKGISDRVVKFGEEFGEFCAEIIKLKGLTYKPFDREKIIEEGADAMQVLFSVVLTVCEETDISFYEFVEAMERKNKKWEDKIDSYQINKDEDLSNTGH